MGSFPRKVREIKIIVIVEVVLFLFLLMNLLEMMSRNVLNQSEE